MRDGQVHLHSLRRDAGEMEHGNRAEARHGGAEVLELVRPGRALEAFDERHRPVVAREPADHGAERAPVVQRVRGPLCADAQRGLALLIQVKAVARRAPGEAGGHGGRPALEIRACPAHRVRIDHHAGVAERHRLAARGRLDGLVVDAGVGHQDAEARERGDGAALELQHPARVLQHRGLREVGAARIGDRGHAHRGAFVARAPRPSSTPGSPEALGVGHDVRLRHRHEVRGAEEIADPDLVLDRAPHRAPSSPACMARSTSFSLI